MRSSLGSATPVPHTPCDCYSYRRRQTEWHSVPRDNSWQQSRITMNAISRKSRVITVSANTARSLRTLTTQPALSMTHAVSSMRFPWPLKKNTTTSCDVTVVAARRTSAIMRLFVASFPGWVRTRTRSHTWTRKRHGQQWRKAGMPATGQTLCPRFAQPYRTHHTKECIRWAYGEACSQRQRREQRVQSAWRVAVKLVTA